MKHKTTAVRLLGGLMMAVALLPWLGGAAAQAADINVHLDPKWTGKTASTSGVPQDSCAYDEIKLTHTGVGWHFVLTGTTGLTSFTAFFQTAGAVTVTTTETAAGVIVQGGKGAVIYTATNDTLVAGGTLGFAGEGSSTGGPDVLQLSHICQGTLPSPSPSPSTSTTPPTTTTTTAPASVAPTTAKASPSTSVQGAKNAKPPAVLPKTGSGMSLGTGLAISLGLLLGGAALMFGSGRVALAKGKRRH